MSHESDGENCPFCQGDSFDDAFISSEHLKVSKFKYKTAVKVRNSVFEKPDVNLDLIMKWI